MENNSSNLVFKNVKVTKVRKYANDFHIFIGYFGNNEHETFKGNFPVEDNQKYDIYGKVTIDKKYGKQIQVISLVPITEIDKSDLNSYLKTFKGIGPAKAKKILDAFGENTLEVIKTDYLKLVNLGIKESVAYEMHTYILKNKILNELVESLTPYQISLTSINKIFKKYKEQSLDLLKYNPYKFREEISVSYKKVDDYALKNGVNPKSTPRILGAINEVMTNISERGNTFFYAADIIELVKNKLNKDITNEDYLCNNADIMKVMIYLEEVKKDLIIKDDSSCYTPYYYYAERNISRKILKMNQDSYKRVLEKDFSEIIKSIEEEIGVTYAPNQKDAIENALKSPVVVITGGPGTGKTTTVNGVIKSFKKIDPNIKILLAAPTGMAAKRMESATGIPSKTIHRLLEYKPFEGELQCGRNEENPLDSDVVIIDESSMIDIPLMYKFLQALKDETQLVLVGDINQLPSVGPGNVLRDLIASKVIAVTKLETIYRQKGTSTIITNAKRINDGKQLDLSQDDFRLFEIDEQQAITRKMEYDKLVATQIVNEYVRLINAGNNLSNVQVLCPMKKKENLASSTAINSMIQERVNPKKQGVRDVKVKHLIFREGDKVIQLTNNYEKSCFNGDIGYITNIKTNGDPIVTVKFDEDREIEFSGSEEISELDLAYAMSVHKSQGSEYDHVLMPMVISQKVLLYRNLLYTGVTRGKKTVTLFGMRKAIDYSLKNTNIDKRFSKLESYLRNTKIRYNA